jgi:hypothetical protein
MPSATSAFVAPGALQRELNAAAEEDRVRQLVDDTKKRAIMTARSYDEFKHRVACAALAPLSRDDLARRVAVAPNRLAGAGEGGVSAAAAWRGQLQPAAPGSVETEHAFYREWRRTAKDPSARLR